MNKPTNLVNCVVIRDIAKDQIAAIITLVFYLKLTGSTRFASDDLKETQS